MGTLLGLFILFLALYVAVNVLYVVARALSFVFGGLFRGVGALLALPFRAVGYLLTAGVADAPGGRPVLGSACGNPMCKCPNIAGARFCRRCGNALGERMLRA